MTYDHERHMQSGQTPKPFVVAGMAIPLCFVAMLSTGCGSTAIIARRDGLQSEGKIMGSNKNNVYVEGQNGGVQGISRANIEDIDHPGNVEATIGGFMTAYGLANIFVFGAPGDSCRRSAVDCVGVFMPWVAGMSVMAHGLTIWKRSVNAADPTNSRTGGRVTVVPMASVDKKNEFLGASAHVSF